MAGSGRRAASRPTNRSTRFIHRTGPPVTVSIPPAGAPDADATSRGTPSGMGRSPASLLRPTKSARSSQVWWSCGESGVLGELIEGVAVVAGGGAQRAGRGRVGIGELGQ